MKKIENWEEIKTNEEVVAFENLLDNLTPGPQIVKILKVEDVTEKEYLKIAFDIVDGKLKGLFRDVFDNDNRDDKKWPNSGILYKSYKESAKRFFAAFITAIEKSNPSYKWDFDETKLIGKLFVANFREEEYVSEDYDDQGNAIIKTSIKCFEPRSTVALKEGKVKILPKKELTLTNGQTREPIYEDQATSAPTPTILKPTDDLPF